MLVLFPFLYPLCTIYIWTPNAASPYQTETPTNHPPEACVGVRVYSVQICIIQADHPVHTRRYIHASKCQFTHHPPP